MKNFDKFIGIDWSGSKSPVKNRSIAVSSCKRGDKAPVLVEGPLDGLWSRQAVAGYIEKEVARLKSKDQRALAGIDCNFGYSEKIGEKQFGKKYNYQDLWAHVDVASKNDKNYFAGGFFDHPQYASYFWTEGKKPEGFEMPKRITEQVCGESGFGWPESPFKMIGPKQVGKGGLAGMRMVYDLKSKLGDDLCIWPFERHVEDTAHLIITEIYPRQFLRRAGFGMKKIRTTGELNQGLLVMGSRPAGKSLRVTDHDTDAIMAAAGLRYICGDAKEVPNEVANPPQMTENAAKREGWIFGAGS